MTQNNKELTIGLICEGPNQIQIPPFTDNHNGSGKPKYTDDLFIILDCSGSTDNRVGSGRCGGAGRCGGRSARCVQSADPNEMNLNSLDLESKSETKIIIAAECEGIIHVLMEYCLSFDICCKVTVIPFSSKFFVFEHEIKNNRDLYDKVITSFHQLPFQSSGTDLLGPVTEIFEKLAGSKPIDIILATDGQSERKDKVLDFLTKREGRKFTFFVIGAGSISSSAGELQFVSRGGNYSRQTSSVGNHTECDIDYLVSLANLSSSTVGSYCGAYGNYKDLIKTVNEYIVAKKEESKPQIAYRVKLDGGKSGDLPNEIFHILSQNGAALIKTPFGHYLVTPNFQLGIDPSRTPGIPDLLTVDKFIDRTQRITQQSGLYDLNFPNLEIFFGNYILYPAFTRDGFFRLRHVYRTNS